MGIELQMLLWSIVLGIVQIALAASFSTAQRGLAWNAGPRDDPPAPLTGVAGRLDRARHNFLETFVFFAAGVLMLAVLDRATPQTATGAQLYFWARVLYVPLYALGVSYVRTAVWAAGLVGVVLVLLPLFAGLTQRFGLRNL